MNRKERGRERLSKKKIEIHFQVTLSWSPTKWLFLLATLFRWRGGVDCIECIDIGQKGVASPTMEHCARTTHGLTQKNRLKLLFLLRSLADNINHFHLFKDFCVISIFIRLKAKFTSHWTRKACHLIHLLARNIPYTFVAWLEQNFCWARFRFKND